MLAKQLSVFLENKSGRLTEVTDVLGNAGVNLSAMSIADNSDFGILRCIVSDPDKAYQVLKASHFAVKMTDVIGFVCPNTSGSLAKVLKHLSENGVFIEYMYSFSNGDVAHVVIRPTDLEGCERILAEKKGLMKTKQRGRKNKRISGSSFFKLHQSIPAVPHLIIPIYFKELFSGLRHYPVLIIIIKSLLKYLLSARLLLITMSFSQQRSLLNQKAWR